MHMFANIYNSFMRDIQFLFEYGWKLDGPFWGNFTATTAMILNQIQANV